MSEKIVIFDLDGTLLDTLYDIGDSLNLMLEHFGYPTYTYEEVKGMIGNGVKVLVHRAIPGGEENPVAYECVEKFKSIYRADAAKKTRPYRGVSRVLRILRGRGIEVAVVTNKVHNAALELCEKFFGDTVSIVLGDREGMRRKPYPDGVFYVMEQLGCKEAVYVGDADTDIDVAKNAGIPSVSVLWGFRDENFLVDHGAEVTVKDANELLRELGRLLRVDFGEQDVSEEET